MAESLPGPLPGAGAIVTTDTLAGLISKTFIARPDVKAVQQKNGAYHPDRTKFTYGDLRAHLEGEVTLGHYLVSQDDKCKLFCYDIDLTKAGGWFTDAGLWVEGNPREEWSRSGGSNEYLTTQLRCMAEGLALRIQRLADIPVAVAYSGCKGIHVYGLTGLVPAAKARAVAKLVLDSWGCFYPSKGENFYRHVSIEPHLGYPSLEIEVYPKQDSLENKDLGNLLRLPLGINQKSQAPGFFLDMRTPYNVLRPAAPEDVLVPGGYRW